jgi:uncharacterized repeat protein (TIGR01451 family)
MFKKLITNLPFQPPLLGQVAFYVHRLRQETVLRRAGFILIALTLVVQMFAIFSPSKASLATSSGDIIYGATSRNDVLNAYVNNHDQLGRNDIKAIYNYYGIGEAQIKSATLTKVKESSSVNYINTSRTTTKFPDTFVKIPGASDGGIYEFPLEYWRQSQYPDGYPALKGTSTYGFTFWILLKGCGNIVFEKGAKKPDLDIVKSRISASKITPGDTVSYQIQFRNQGLAIANNVAINDKLANEFEFISYKSSLDLTFLKTGQQLTWRVANKGSTLAPSDRWHTITLTLRARDITQSSLKVCNASSIDASNSGAKISDNSTSARCVTIDKPTCPGTGLPIPSGGVNACKITCPDGSTLPYNQTCKIPQLSCQELSIIGEPAWNIRKFQTTIIMQPGAVAKQVDYFINGKKVASQPVMDGATTQVFSYTFAGSATYQIRADVIAKTGSVQASQGCTLTETIDKPSIPIARLTTDKIVSNLSQKISDANNTTAKAGDVLRYTISIENTGDAPTTLMLDGEYGESIADILEYANLTDKADATFNAQTGFLSWGSTTIKPSEKVTKSFMVTIKDPIPATPVSFSNPLSYDYVLHNKYGRDVNVKLDKPASKVVEQTVTTLPNTGPSSSMFVTVAITVVIGYFFYRSRLMSQELEIIHHEYSTGGM